MDKNIRCSYTKNIPVINLLTVKQLVKQIAEESVRFRNRTVPVIKA